jgi:phosphoribosyl-AMP cyclohydrolase
MNVDELRFDDRGLIPAIVQDADNGGVLMVAWMNREALARTLEDCDGDVLLVRVHQVGAACHTGERSCFFNTLSAATDR